MTENQIELRGKSELDNSEGFFNVLYIKDYGNGNGYGYGYVLYIIVMSYIFMDMHFSITDFTSVKHHFSIP